MNQIKHSNAPVTAHVCKYDGRTGELVQERDIITPLDVYLGGFKAIYPIVSMEPNGNGGTLVKVWPTVGSFAGSPRWKFNIQPNAK